MEAPLRGRQSAFRPVFEALGEARVRTVLEDFYRRQASDAMIGFFFFGRDSRAIAHKQLDFLAYVSGARAEFQGRVPQDAHHALPPIRRGQFDRRLVLLRQTLDSHGVAPELIERWVGFEATFRQAVTGTA